MKKLLAFIFSASIFTCCLAQSTKQPVTSPDPAMVSLMNEAKKLMMYKIYIELPKIQPATEEHIKSIGCNGIEYCPISAVYLNNVVYYRQDLNVDNPVTKSILIHEFIHHIQAKTGFAAFDCNMWYNNEKEAYRLQAKYLRNNDQDDGFVRETLRFIKCP